MRYMLLIAVSCLAATASAETVSYGYDAFGRVIGTGHFQGPLDGYRDDISMDNADNRSYYWLADTKFTLSAGDSRYSGDTYTRLVMQNDGNLVIYYKGTGLWSSGTAGRGANRAIFQSDGNLVLYTSANQVVWSSGTGGSYGALLAVQNDGNAVIYDVSRNPIWSSASPHS